jgi:hypothetical protein
MFGPERLEAIEVKISNCERSRSLTEIGSAINPMFVPGALRDLATWYVASFRAPNDFADAVIVRLVPR